MSIKYQQQKKLYNKCTLFLFENHPFWPFGRVYLKNGEKFNLKNAFLELSQCHSSLLSYFFLIRTADPVKLQFQQLTKDYSRNNYEN